MTNIGLKTNSPWSFVRGEKQVRGGFLGVLLIATAVGCGTADTTSNTKTDSKGVNVTPVSEVADSVPTKTTPAIAGQPSGDKSAEKAGSQADDRSSDDEVVEFLRTADIWFQDVPIEERVAKESLDIVEKAGRPQEWFDLNAQLTVMLFDSPDRKLRSEKELRVAELKNKVLAESKSLMAMSPELAKEMAELELLQHRATTDQIAKSRARMIVLELASVTEEVQKQRNTVESMQNARTTLPVVREAVARHRMLEKAATPELKEARKTAVARIADALKQDPEYVKADLHSRELAARLMPDGLAKSRATVRELVKQALAEHPN